MDLQIQKPQYQYLQVQQHPQLILNPLEVLWVLHHHLYLPQVQSMVLVLDTNRLVEVSYFQAAGLFHRVGGLYLRVEELSHHREEAKTTLGSYSESGPDRRAVASIDVTTMESTAAYLGPAPMETGVLATTPPLEMKIAG